VVGPRVGVVGTGFGARVHVPALRAAGFDVVGMAGTDADRTRRRAERLGVALATTEVGELIREVDAVTVATPPATHRPLVLAAVHAGRHVWCEKPFAVNSTEATEMVTAADRAGVVAIVGHEFRYEPARIAVAAALADGLVGDPRVATFVQLVDLVADPTTPMPSWWFDASAGGGWLGASGSHLVDQVRVWLGDFAGVSAALRRVVARPSNVDDSFTVRARLRCDCDVVLQQSAAAWGPPGGLTRVVGTHGSIGLDGERAWVADREGVRDLPLPEPFGPEVTMDADRDPAARSTRLELAPAARLAAAWRTAIEGGAASTPGVALPTFGDGLATTKVLDAIRASAAAEGARVAI
jgi:predicted dehydrogenase